MSIEVTAYGTLTEDQLRAAEEQIEAPLPPPYRRWLAETNGGKPGSPAVISPRGTPETNFLWEHKLFGVRPEDQLSDIVFNYGDWDDRFTDSYLSVGLVSGGILALKIKGDDTGSVWFWDDDDPRASDDDNPEDIERLLYRVADDWDQLMERFEPYELSSDNGPALS